MIKSKSNCYGRLRSRALSFALVIFGVSGFCIIPAFAQSQNAAEQQETPKYVSFGSSAIGSGK